MSSQDYHLSGILNKVAKENKGFFVGYVILTILFQLCWVFSPYTFSMLIDQKQIFSRYIIIPVVIFITGYALEYCCDVLDYYFTERLNARVTEWSTERLFNSFKRRFATSSMTDGIASINRLSQTCAHTFRDGRIFVMGLVFASIVCISFLFFINKYLGIYLLTTVLCLLGLFGVFIYRAIKLTSTTEFNRDRMLDNINDILVNMPSVYGNNQVENELNRIKTGCSNLETSSKIAQKTIQSVRIGINIFYIVIVAGLFLLSAYLYKKEILSTGILATIVMITMYMIYNFDELSINSGNLIRNIGQLIHTQKFLDQLQIYEDMNPDGLSAVPPVDGSIVVNNISVILTENVVLRNLSIDIRPGEVILLTGRNGSGKSTLMKAIFGALPYSGSILLGGQEIRDMQASVLRSNITYVPQIPTLFNRSVYENISYGNGATREEVISIMDDFGINFLSLDDIIGNTHLSGGQQQLIYLLRACLHKKSTIILLDEPTSALDTKTRDKAMLMIQSLLQGRTAIIISHDDDLIRYSTRTIALG